MRVRTKWLLWLGMPALLTTALASQVFAGGADFAGQRSTVDARQVADWVVDSHDNGALPFTVVDKREARVFVFDAQGQLRGATQALLGLTPGDDGAPDLNQRDLSRLAAFERTTPAGRYLARPGRNLKGEDVVWVDYSAALAIHRLRPAPMRERRAERMVSASAADRRISLGCVVVPVTFYEGVVAPMLGKSRSMVYILPETRPLAQVFGWQ